MNDGYVNSYQELLEVINYWVDVQKRAGEFKDVADADIMKYFMERFGVSTSVGNF